jgi:hypothetical protein
MVYFYYSHLKFHKYGRRVSPSAPIKDKRDITFSNSASDPAVRMAVFSVLIGSGWSPNASHIDDTELVCDMEQSISENHDLKYILLCLYMQDVFAFFLVLFSDAFLYLSFH